MGGDPNNAIPICGETFESACGTGSSDDDAPNPYDCKDCDTVLIFDGFSFDRSHATAQPACQANFTFPKGYGDVYYRDKRLYDAFGKK